MARGQRKIFFGVWLATCKTSGCGAPFRAKILRKNFSRKNFRAKIFAKFLLFARFARKRLDRSGQVVSSPKNFLENFWIFKIQKILAAILLRQNKGFCAFLHEVCSKTSKVQKVHKCTFLLFAGRKKDACKACLARSARKEVLCMRHLRSFGAPSEPVEKNGQFLTF